MNKQFLHYQIIEEIGRGGMGLVYKARDMRLNRFVALKVITSTDISQKDIQRFILETRAISQVQHHNIVRLFDVGFQPRVYFTMEYICGKNLDECTEITNNFKLIAQIMVRICDALEVVHSNNILHRDIKPANIMVDNELNPKLMDFGLAKMVDHKQSLSQEGTIIGTPAYMPCEQALGEKLDCRADIYSLGATLYHILTNRSAFAGDSYFQLIHRVCSEDPVLPKTINPSIPKELQIICLKCMEKKKSRRYQSASELKTDLQNFLQQRPINAQSPSRLYRLQKWCHRHTLLTVFILMLSAGIFITSWFSYRTWKSEQKLSSAYQALNKSHQDISQLNEKLREISSQREEALRRANSKLLEAHRKMIGSHIATQSFSPAIDEAKKAYHLARATQHDLQFLFGDLLRYSLLPHQAQLLSQTDFPTEIDRETDIVSSEKLLAGKHKNIYLWDIATKSKIREIKGKLPLLISATQKTVVYTRNGQVFVQNIQSGAQQKFPFAEKILKLAISADEKWIVVRHYAQLVFLHLKSGKRQVLYNNLGIANINQMKFVNNEEFVTSIDSSIGVWKLKKNKWRIVSSDTYLGQEVCSVAKSSNYLVYGNLEGGITFVNTKNKRSTSHSFIHKAAISAIAFSDDERLLATTSKDGVFVVWDMLTIKPVLRHSVGTRITDCYFTAQHTLVISAYDRQRFYRYEFAVIKSFDMLEVNKERRHYLKAFFDLGASIHQLASQEACITTNGRYISAAYSMGLVTWDVVGQKNYLFIVDGNVFHPPIIRVESQGTKIAVLYANGRICVLDAKDHRVICDMQKVAHAGSTALQFSQNGKYIFFHRDPELCMLEIATKKIKPCIKLSTQISSLQYAAPLLFVSSKENVSAYLFNENSGAVQKKWTTPLDKVVRKTWVKDNFFVVNFENEREINLYKVDNGLTLWQHKKLREIPYTVSLSPHNDKLMCFGKSSVQLFDLQHHFSLEVFPACYPGGIANVDKSWQWLCFPSIQGSLVLKKIPRDFKEHIMEKSK